MAYVYRHIRLDTNVPFYIGISDDNDGTFKRAYDLKARNESHRDITAITDVHVDIIMNDLSWEDACEKEKEFIKLYGRLDMTTGTLTNLTEGGSGFGELSSTIRQKMSVKAKLNHVKYPEKYLHTDETKKKISSSSTGKKFSESHKQKLRESKLGKKRVPMSDEQKAIRSLKLKGRRRADVAERNKNRIPPCLGKIRITNGIQNMFILPTSEIPQGWTLYSKYKKETL
jgi:hypothetical protein